MFLNTLYGLVQGDQPIEQYFQNARNIWKGIIESEAFNSVESLAYELNSKQGLFESQCGGKYIGREIMAIVGFGQYFSMLVGFDVSMDEIVKIKNAFEQSFCSVEVKWQAENAAKVFGLENDMKHWEH